MQKCDKIEKRWASRQKRCYMYINFLRFHTLTFLSKILWQSQKQLKLKYKSSTCQKESTTLSRAQ